MQQLIADVLPYFLALYVLDSLAFVRAHEVAFLRPWRAFGVARPSVVLAGLAPQAEVIVCVELPVRLGAETVGWPSDGGWMAVPWDDLGAIEVEQRSLRCGDRAALRLPSPEAAQWLATLLRQLRAAPAGQRRAQAEKLSDAATDVGAIRKLRLLHLRHARALSLLGATLGIGWFAVLPWAVFGHGPGPNALPVLALLLVVHVAVCVLSWRTVRACGVRRGSALGILSTFAFLLPAAAHARFVLGRTLYVRFDPLAVAAVLLPAGAFAALARREFHRNRLEGAAWPFLAAHSGLRERAWQRTLAAAGASAAEVLRAPSSDDSSAATYCPLCALEYRPGFASCSDCGTLLEPLYTSRSERPLIQS